MQNIDLFIGNRERESVGQKTSWVYIVSIYPTMSWIFLRNELSI